MFFSSNIKALRGYKQKTQDVIARELGMSRSTLNSYENGSVKNPTLDALISFSKYYKVSIDTLVKTDLSKLGQFQLSELLKGHDIYITGSKLRVLATTLDSFNKENIEVVPLKAKAGYKNGFADPDFIKKLPAFQLPILFNDRKYRMFQIDGDSMLPIPDKSWVIAEYVENWYEIKSNHAYVLLTKEEGIVFKNVVNEIKRRKKMVLHSLNPEYKPYEVDVNEVKEVWKFCNYISSEIPEPMQQKDQLLKSVVKMENELMVMKNRLKEELALA
ncbi:MAG: helix-turn-helix domain-containing protein [Chitinophagales bacterium]|nr:helix-turn-helix domain-containing protein [Chitinophagales bacterium]